MDIQLACINSHNGVTVKDVPAKDFIEAFAKHLKKGNKIKMPEVSVFTGSSSLSSWSGFYFSSLFLVFINYIITFAVGHLLQDRML